jgi:hypothetical protein
MLSTEGSSVKSTKTRGGSDMDEEYSKEIAGYILSIFRTNPFVVMSWGINPASITIVDVGVRFHVQGFLHTGYVQVVLNEGEDLFEVTLISEDGETLKTIEHIFVDNLICVIDSVVEKCENYQERISQEYQIITGTEK